MSQEENKTQQMKREDAFGGFDQPEKENGENTAYQEESSQKINLGNPQYFYATQGVAMTQVGSILMIIMAIFGTLFVQSFAIGGLFICTAIVNLIVSIKRSNTPALKIDTEEKIVTIGKKSFMFNEVKSWSYDAKKLHFQCLLATAQSDDEEVQATLHLHMFTEDEKQEVLDAIEAVFGEPTSSQR